MAHTFTVLVDDQDSQINYLCPTLKQQVVGSYSNNTWSTIRSESCKDGWFEYTFYGTGIRVEIPIARPSENVEVMLDNTPFKPQSDGTFESPILPDGEHTITYSLGDVSLTPVFDYLTVTAGPSTPLNGKTLIVDDDDSQISFKGNWSRNPPNAISYDYSTSLYRDTAHWSSTVGDSLEFQFTGTSVSVFGLAANITGANNNITLSYTLDGVTRTQAIPEGTLDSVPMSEFFHAENLAAGAHTLVINLTDVAYPRAVGVDFIAYNTSVDSVSSLPGYVSPPTASSAPQFDAGSGGLSRSQKWIIVGGVFGAFVFFAILILLFLVWKSRRSDRKSTPVLVSSNNSSFDDIEAIKQQSGKNFHDK